MARAIWTGSISFGLVSIPVGLFSATENHTIGFHQFERDTSDRVRNLRVNERTGDEVDYNDIVKGADVGDGEHVIIEPEELRSIAPGQSHGLEITDFVNLDEIDPLYFNKAYWLGPTAEQHARPYALLLEAMTRTNRAGIGTLVMRGKQYLAAIRADGDVLALHTLHFADEVRDPAKTVENLPKTGTAKGKELDMATQLIESMSGPWKPEQYDDSYRDRVAELIEDKRKGRETVTESEPPEPTDMSDLVSALERSISASGGSRGQGGNGRPDLDDATKAELTDLARDLDISGRSRMTRDELVDAIRRADRQKRAS
ncbi:Ku protein [Pseudonocardia spinosispora]|uniref:non-homologous end joining protein Ku n=1 Tax=Pseudonocardia spinosispora TaxID=103441 RepID=UPI0003FCE17B|nr:Ku protein [Pseudonocardia spinosispora]